MAMTYREYDLNEHSIDAISAELQTQLDGLKLERRDIQRIRLTVEALLLNIMEGCGKGIRLSLGIGKRFGRQVLRLRYAAPPFDPTGRGEDAWSADFLRTLGYAPAWSHRIGVNTVSLTLAERTQKSTVFYTLIAVLFAFLLGTTGRMLPEGILQTVCDTLLTPLTDSFLGLLKTFSGIMILFTICSGIIGMGGMETLERTGKSVVLRTMAFSIAVGIGAIVLLQPFFDLEYHRGMRGDAEQLKAVSRLIFDILPSNIVEPFSSGNLIQIIVIAGFVSMGLLAIGERGARVRGLIDDSAALTQHIVSTISACVPLFVFAMLLKQFLTGDAGALLFAWKPLLTINLSYLVLVVPLWLFSAVRLKCAPAKLLKMVFPPFLIAFTTNSSLSAMALSMDTCERKFEAQKKMVSFLYPLDLMTYKPLSIVYFTALVLSFAEMYQVEVSLPWMITACILCLLLSVAAPPIPGAGITVYAILFTSLGLPLETVMMATAIEMVSDYLYTGCTVALQILHVACESNRLGYLDRAILERNL